MFTVINVKTQEIVGKFLAFNNALDYFYEVLKLKKGKIDITSDIIRDGNVLIVTYDLGLDNWKIVQRIGE